MDTCKYIFRSGKFAGEECPEVTDGPGNRYGYCRAHINDPLVFSSLGLVRCRTPYLYGLSTDGNVRICGGLYDEANDYCYGCWLRTQPRVSAAYPNTIKEVEELYRKDSTKFNLINLLSLSCPCQPDEMWGYLNFDKGEVNPVIFNMNVVHRFRFDHTKLKIEIRRGNGIQPDVIYYVFENGPTYILYPESGYVVDIDRTDVVVFCARDWIRIFGCPGY